MPENPYDQLVNDIKEVRRSLREALATIALVRAQVTEAHATTADLLAGAALRREEWTAGHPAPSPSPDCRAILTSLIDQLMIGAGPSVRSSSDPADQLATLADAALTDPFDPSEREKGVRPEGWFDDCERKA